MAISAEVLLIARAALGISAVVVLIGRASVAMSVDVAVIACVSVSFSGYSSTSGKCDALTSFVA